MEDKIKDIFGAYGINPSVANDEGKCTFSLEQKGDLISAHVTYQSFSVEFFSYMNVSKTAHRFSLLCDKNGKLLIPPNTYMDIHLLDGENALAYNEQNMICSITHLSYNNNELNEEYKVTVARKNGIKVTYKQEFENELFINNTLYNYKERKVLGTFNGEIIPSPSINDNYIQEISSLAGLGRNEIFDMLEEKLNDDVVLIYQKIVSAKSEPLFPMRDQVALTLLFIDKKGEFVGDLCCIKNNQIYSIPITKETYASVFSKITQELEDIEMDQIPQKTKNYSLDNLIVKDLK